MRILYFSRDYTTHDRRFLLKLAASRHEIHFLRLEDDGLPYETRPLPPGIRAVKWPGGYEPARTPEAWLRLMPAFEAVLAEVQPDLVHAGPIQSCGWLAALADFHPLLVMSWGSDLLIDAARDPFWKWMTQFTLRRVDWLLCDSATIKQLAQTYAPLPDERVISFPWGIDLAAFAPGSDELGLHVRWGGDVTVVLHTRAWEPVYNVFTALEGFRLAQQANSGLRLVMLGAGSLADEVQAYIKAQKLDAAIYCPGLLSHQQLPHYFRAADLYLSCAQSDGTSISMLEALACGLPVVVSDLPSNREWITPGVNGWLAAPGASTAFADGLTQAATLSPAARADLGGANRRLAEQRGQWDLNIQKLFTAYDEIEAGLGRPAAREK